MLKHFCWLPGEQVAFLPQGKCSLPSHNVGHLLLVELIHALVLCWVIQERLKGLHVLLSCEASHGRDHVELLGNKYGLHVGGFEVSMWRVKALTSWEKPNPTQEIWEDNAEDALSNLFILRVQKLFLGSLWHQNVCWVTHCYRSAWGQCLQNV